MKFFIPILLALITLNSCGTNEIAEKSGNNADSLYITDNFTLPKPEMGDFSNPKFSPDDSKLFFTSAGFKGIWYYDFSDSSVRQISSQNGTGYNFIFSGDGGKIYYQLPASTISNGEQKYSLLEQNIKTGKINVLLTSEEKFLQLKYLEDGNIFFIQDNETKILNPDNNQIDKPENHQTKIVFNETNGVKKYYKGEEKELVSTDKNIIWVEENPVNNKVLYYAIGEGAVVVDSSGVKETLGDFRAAKWSPNGNFILYMIDEDDGHRVTASDIYAYSVKNKNSFKLTNTTGVVEMNPVWSNGGDRIAFNTLDGFILSVKVKYE